MKKKYLTTAEAAELRERRYNTIKMRIALMNTDALLRLILLPWMLFAGIIAILYAIAPSSHPLHLFVVWSLGCYLGHYIIVGMTRRMAETYLTKLCATEGEFEQCRSAKHYEDDAQRPYKTGDDPALTRLSFGITNALGIPRRGLGHMLIALSHWLILFLYAMNYVLYFRHSDLSNAPADLFMLHLMLTIAGVVMILKNAGYLIKSKDIIALIRGVLDWRGVVSRGAAAVELENEDPEATIKSSMEAYRFKNNKPPVTTCHTCIQHMAKHIVDEIPFVVVDDEVRAEIVSRLIKLRKRSPKFAEALRELLLKLKRDSEDPHAQIEEFMKILCRTEELVEALYFLSDDDPERTRSSE